MTDVRERLDAADDDAIDLRPYVRAVWRWRLPILLVALVCGGLMYARASRAVPVYQARAHLLIVMPTAAAIPFRAQDPTYQAWTIAMFQKVIENQDVAARVVKQLQLDKEPVRMTAAGLAGSLSVQSISPPSIPATTPVWEIGLTLADPALAAKIVNQYCDEAIALAKTTIERENDVVKLQVDRAKANLDAAQGKLVSALESRAAAPVKEVEVARLRADFDVATRVYAEAALRYERTQLIVATDTARLNILDRAVPAETPLPRRPWRRAALAAVVGLLLAAGVVVAPQFLSSARGGGRGASRV